MRRKLVENKTNRQLMAIFLIFLLLGLLSLVYTGFFRDGFKELDNPRDEIISAAVLIALGLFASGMFIIFLFLTPNYIMISDGLIKINYLIFRKPTIIDLDRVDYIVIDIRAPKLTIIMEDLSMIMISTISLEVKDNIAHHAMKNGVVVKSIDHYRGFIGRDHIEMMDHYKIISDISD